MTTNEQKIPVWFWIVAVILLLWNLMGVMNFIGQVSMSQEDIDALTEVEKSLMENRPVWALIAFAVAVFGGLAASIMLVLKKKIAYKLFIVSLLGVAVQFTQSILASPAEVFTTAVIGLTTIIIVVALFSVWFSKHAAGNNWIR